MNVFGAKQRWGCVARPPARRSAFAWVRLCGLWVCPLSGGSAPLVSAS